MKESKKQELVIFKAGRKSVKLRGDFRNETLWATQAEIADIFGSERSVITKHIRNIFKDGELVQDSVCAKIAHTAEDGKTYQVSSYNLDVIISVGYRLENVSFQAWVETPGAAERNPGRRSLFFNLA